MTELDGLLRGRSTPAGAPEPASSPGSSRIVRVVSAGEDEVRVAALEGDPEPWSARSALSLDTVLAPGDEVVQLVTAEGPVIIAKLRSAEGLRHALSDGTQVRIEAGATRLRVQRSDGTPLFVYEAREGHGTVTLAGESVQVAASAGDLCLSAAGEIRLQARALTACASMPGHASTLALSPRSAKLAAASLELESSAFRLSAGQVAVQATEARTELKRAVFTAERLETAADVVVSRARNVYQHVHELWQQQVGSLRTLVSGTAQLKAREVAHRAEEAYKIRAEKIHLG